MKTTFLFIIIFFAILAKSQNVSSIDSLQNILSNEKADTSKVIILNEISQEYLKSDFNKSLEYAKKALEISKEINDEKSIALSYTYVAYAQYRLNIYDEAKININKALTIYEILKNVSKISSCYSFISQIYYAKQEYSDAIKWVNKSIKIKKDNNITDKLEVNYLTLGAILQKQGLYKLALENFFTALNYYDKNGKANSKASVYNNIAIIYRKLKNNDLAEEYYKKSLNLYIKNNDSFGELKIYNNLAVLYEKQGLYKRAINNYKQVLKLSKAVNFQGGIAMSQINLSGIYIESNTNLDTAFTLLKESEKICIDITDNYKLAFVYGLFAQYFIKTDNFKLAIENSLKGYKIAVKIGSTDQIADLSLQLSELYKEQKDFENALKYFEIFHTTNDSIFNIEKTTVIEEMKTRFDISNKEKELKISKQKLKLLEKKEKIDTIKFYALIIVLALVLLLIIVTLILFKNRSNKKKELEQKNKEIAEAEKKMLLLEIQDKESEKTQLTRTINYKDTELQNFAHYIVDKNDFIIKIQKDLKKLQKNISEKNIGDSLQSILADINNKIQIIRNSEEFLAQVDQINNNFYFKLREKHADITENELRLASLLKMGLSSKEIASILHITSKSVDTNRYRLRKKLELNQDINLFDYFKNL